eukprot:scaffold75647_cov63-Phaeocystis_antarctica.AAC.1
MHAHAMHMVFTSPHLATQPSSSSLEIALPSYPPCAARQYRYLCISPAQLGNLALEVHFFAMFAPGFVSGRIIGAAGPARTARP